MTKQELKSEIENFRNVGYVLMDIIEANQSHVDDAYSAINDIEVCISNLRQIERKLGE